MKKLVHLQFRFLVKILLTQFLTLSSSSSFSASNPSIAPVYPSMTTVSPGVLMGSDQEHRLDAHKKLLIGLIISSSSLGIIILICFGFWIYCRKKAPKPIKISDAESGTSSFSMIMRRLSSIKTHRTSSNQGYVQRFDSKTLEKATGGFKDSNVIGQGGFGCVYKASLDNNTKAAVKKIENVSQEAKREFQNEVELLSKIQHSNIISLLGSASEINSSFIVYELMETGSLDDQLHGPSCGSALTWHMRMKIALDTARGLEYLHEHCRPPVIHRDLKSSNILLDSSFNAKISDFGLAVSVGVHGSNNIKLSGTLGYVAPEYLLDGKLTDKSDVYAFGVVLLELLLGRRPVEKLSPSQCQSLVTWAMPQLTDRSKLPNIVDPVIKDSMDLKHLYQVAAMAVLCVQPEPSYRPLITDVLHSLVPLVPVELGGTLRLTR
ncbi:Protein kinase superfamily protein [Raphanus sativus]|uniref:Probable receptor-like protein kinase At1g80640 isoform X1 n=2 Tax=Raphanus sativus TaxID=3726 RepID=A0A6J0N2B8_RAPSA|nr:probable receptor-like protein kinase At1g80640 isoform X1 [Raphanus sativus]KAJ4902981.1 Protein kinase superfamily protein [Raphanus sativus]